MPGFQSIPDLADFIVLPKSSQENISIQIVQNSSMQKFLIIRLEAVPDPLGPTSLWLVARNDPTQTRLSKHKCGIYWKDTGCLIGSKDNVASPCGGLEARFRKPLGPALPVPAPPCSGGKWPPEAHTELAAPQQWPRILEHGFQTQESLAQLGWDIFLHSNQWGMGGGVVLGIMVEGPS